MHHTSCNCSTNKTTGYGNLGTCLRQSSGQYLELAASARLQQLDAGIHSPSQAGVKCLLLCKELRYLTQQLLHLQPTICMKNLVRPRSSLLLQLDKMIRGQLIHHAEHSAAYRIHGVAQRHDEGRGGRGGKGVVPVRHKQHLVPCPVCVEAVKLYAGIECHYPYMSLVSSCMW